MPDEFAALPPAMHRAHMPLAMGQLKVLSDASRALHEVGVAHVALKGFFSRWRSTGNPDQGMAEDLVNDSIATASIYRSPSGEARDESYRHREGDLRAGLEKEETLAIGGSMGLKIRQMRRGGQI